MARTPFDPLDPDYGPQTVHSSDLFFINNPMNSQQNNNPSPSISTQLYPYHQQAFHHYTPPVHDGSRPLSYPRQSVYPSYVPNNPIPPPPLPPKPPPAVYPQIAPTTVYNAYAGPSRPHLTQPPPLPPPPPPPQEVQNEEPIDDSNELAMVLALSQSESTERKKMEEQLLDQEEQDLARALAESMSMLPTGAHDTNPFVLPASQVASSSRTEASPKRPPDDLPAQDASHKLEFPADPTNPFADIRRHDQWHVPDKPQEDVPSIAESSSLKRFSFSGLSFPISEPTNETTENARSISRPLSISSVSSLPYTLPDPPTRSNTLDAKDALPEYSQAGATQFTPQDAPVAGPSTIPTNVDVVHIAESMDTVLVFDDEAYARQLEAEEQELSRQYLEEKNRPPDMQGEQPLGEGLPQYPSSIPQQSSWQRIEMVPSRLIIPSQATPAVSGGASRPTPTQPQPPAFGGAQLRQHEFLPRPVSSMPEAGPSAMFYSSPGPRRQSDADTRSDASHQSSGHSSTGPQTAHPERLTRVHQIEQPPQSSPERRPSYSSAGPQTAHPERSNHVRRIEQQPPHSNPERHPGYSTVPSPQADNRVPSTAHHLPSPAALNAHHFLDRELLLGVSIGFQPPMISTRLVPLPGPMPTLISLPYARCPPLHLQAPDWRHLLRLMARLSNTRIEPTVEAMAISKTELKLRTVVQFIKPHPSSNDWRTILWFSMDHPVPPNAPGASRHLSGNPNLLPWSYTLSPVPVLLRDAADTQVSKTFTIPESDTVPLPTLPISFANLALYLQAALDDSRRHSADGSNLGKLGKVVQMCYPSVEQNFLEFDVPERSSVSGLFKRVIGRGHKDKKKGKQTNNEETYQLVTPFVPDEWG